MLSRGILRLSLVLIGLGCSLGQTHAAVKEWQNESWDFVSETDGIGVFRKSFQNSAVKGVGGEAMVDASIGKILGVLMDNEHKREWVDKFKDTRTLEVPGPLVSIQYAAFSMPFPVADRDFVYRYDFSVDKAQNAVVIMVKGVEHPKAPATETVGVRGNIVHGRYLLYPKGANKTFVKVEYLTDPKGMLPTWVVNLVQKRWPYKTLLGLRNQVTKSFVKEWDIYETTLKSQLNLNL